MPFTLPSTTADTLAACAARAASRYEVSAGLVQDWLKPTTLLFLDGLLGEEAPPTDLWVAVNNMRSDEHRLWAAEESRAQVEHYEVLVDFHYFQGACSPYRTVLTAESEGHPQAARGLAGLPVPGKGTEWPNNGLIWDLWKLLLVPSPMRVFTTLATAAQFERIAEHFGGVLARYVDTATPSAFALVCFDPDGTPDASVRVARWAGGEWTVPPALAERVLAG